MCNHNCNQGRNCPTPQACELPIQFAGQEPKDEDEPMPTSFAIALWIAGSLLAVTVVSFIAGCVAGPN